MNLKTLINKDFLNSFNKLSLQNIPVRTAYRIKKMREQFDKETKEVGQLHLELIKKYASKKEDGTVIESENGNIDVDPKNLEVFYKEFEELVAENVEIVPLKLSELGEITLSVSDLVNLDSLIVD
jgi:hypothetical protein